MAKSIRVGVDTGGTFTDFVFEQDGHIQLFKLPSTPSDPSLAIRQGLEQICSKMRVDLAAAEVVHGTTVGTNALLQRRGAKTALITTKGFEDVLVIGRQARPELYNLNAVKPPPLVADDLRLGVTERVVASGEVLQPLDASELKPLVEKLKRAGVESVAVSLLFSFLHPEHEELLAEGIAALGVPISISSRILPEYREYERTSTVVINAYLQPLMGRYLNRLTKHEGQSTTFDLRVMQSSGGSISAEMAAVEPVRTILSGPSGGVVGALRAAQAAKLQNIVTFDMGGTSTDVALCDNGTIRTTNEATVAGLPVAVSVMDIHTVGAGGGSIARVDEGGSLRVGPESAGADPGPACYGRSLLPTVTDAHVVLGHFGGGGLLGGEFKLDERRAHEAIKVLAGEISKASGKRCSPVTAAEGVLSVANTNMERALRHISVERGHDPRQFALLPFGGAGGLHAVELARALRIPLVIAPQAPGALSAVGVMVADVIKDQSRTVMFRHEPKQIARLQKVFAEMEHEAAAVLRGEGFARAQQRRERSLAMRYRGQSFELEVTETTRDIAASFHRAHRERYGYAQEQSEVEIVSARLRSFGLTPKLPVRKVRPASGTAKPERHVTTWFDGQRTAAGVYNREELRGGVKLKTPCIVTEYSATTLIPSDASARVDQFGNILIKL
ncbi:MAG TPA: hydantoinase/oxoprolinase family protein [Pyrinomonadaceae bacterium]|nr:hydantoinase/oxoprolinase family protein [Pyrinomonadaceae bacterium]